MQGGSGKFYHQTCNHLYCVCSDMCALHNIQVETGALLYSILVPLIVQLSLLNILTRKSNDNLLLPLKCNFITFVSEKYLCSNHGNIQYIVNDCNNHIEFVMIFA